MRIGRVGVQTVTCTGTTCQTPPAHGFSPGLINDIWFDVTGGTIYSGVSVYKMYAIDTTPTANTFTFKQYTGNNAGGAAINAGSAGTGTMTVGVSSKTMVSVSGTFTQFAKILATNYVGDRPVGMPNLVAYQYEGNPEPKGLNAVDCVALGVVTSPPDGTGAACAAKIAAALEDWRFNTLAGATQKDYFRQWVGTDPAMPLTYGLMQYGVGDPITRYPAQLVFLCDIDYAFYSTCLPVAPPRQTYYGFQQFNFLLKRDLDPASNDNDPLWLEKAA